MALAPLSRSSLVLLCLLSLGGCEWLRTPVETTFSPAGTRNALTPQPQVKLVQTPDSTWIEPAPGDQTIETLIPGNEDNRQAMDRLKRLESEMDSMRKDMALMVPAVTRLAEAQAPQILQPSAPLLPLEPVTPAAAPVSIAPTPASTSATGRLSQVRLGEHPGKTRIVFDVSNNVAYKQSIDNAEKILTVELPGLAWLGAAQTPVAGSPRIASYALLPDGQGGTRAAFQLKGQAILCMAQYIPASGANSARIVIDLSGS